MFDHYSDHLRSQDFTGEHEIITRGNSISRRELDFTESPGFYGSDQISRKRAQFYTKGTVFYGREQDSGVKMCMWPLLTNI